MKVGTKIKMKYGYEKHPPGLKGTVVEGDVSLGTNVPGNYLRIKLENDDELMILASFLEKDEG